MVVTEQRVVGVREVGCDDEVADELVEPLRPVLEEDRVPQGTEQLTRWATQSSEPVAEFAAAASFRATNLKPEVMQTLCVFTEVSVAGRDAPLQQTRAFP